MQPRKFRDVQVGDRYGRLTILSRSDRRGTGWHYWWHCICDCGNLAEVNNQKLKEGQTRSCGCLRRETCSAIGKTNRTHGEAARGSMTAEFRIWTGIVARVTNPTDPRWHYYGALGVTICDEWRNSYEAFLSYVGRRPTLRHSIDRWPNPFGNYEPGNVRWATMKEQGRNRRNNTLLTINGETLCLAEWEERYGLPKRLVSKRLSQGCPVDKLFLPSQRSRGTHSSATTTN